MELYVTKDRFSTGFQQTDYRTTAEGQWVDGDNEGLDMAHHKK